MSNPAILCCGWGNRNVNLVVRSPRKICFFSEFLLKITLEIYVAVGATATEIPGVVFGFGRGDFQRE